jgi:hypothetical protein
MLVVAILTTDTKKIVFQSPAFKILIKLSRNMARQKASRFAQAQLKIWPMALDKLVKYCLLWLVADIGKHFAARHPVRPCVIHGTRPCVT